MEAGKFSFKFSRQTQKNIVGSSKYAYFSVLFICSAISSSEKCFRVSKTESYGLSRICFEMTRQATMPSSSEKCLRVSKTESYTLIGICFEMTRQATMPSSKAWLCLADEQRIGFELLNIPLLTLVRTLHALLQRWHFFEAVRSLPLIPKAY
jgi:hypothetical protein